MKESALRHIKPEFTFSSFVPHVDSQNKALMRMRGLTSDIISGQDEIIRSAWVSPFKKGKMLILSGTSGGGKTHLLSAMVNEFRKSAQKLQDKIFLFSRGNFLESLKKSYNELGINPFDKYPIMIIHDIGKGYHTAGNLVKSPEFYTHFLNFLETVYDDNKLVIATSRFSFKDVILPGIEQYTSHDGVLSQCETLMTEPGGEVVIDSVDFRELTERLARENGVATPLLSSSTRQISSNKPQ